MPQLEIIPLELGLPLLMAGFKAIAGPCAIFWVVPICGGVLALASYAIGRPIVGLAAAWLVATSPTQLFMLMEVVRAAVGEKTMPAHFFIITMQDDNPLRRVAEAHRMRIIDHAANIGGRFSVLSSVGLLPAGLSDAAVPYRPPCTLPKAMRAAPGASAWCW